MSAGIRSVTRRLAGVCLCVGCTAAPAATILVDTAVDEFGSGDSCSLREAIQSANNNTDFGGCTHTGFFGPAFIDRIELPPLTSGAFTLTRFTGHDDANNSTDLDIHADPGINGRLSIVGVSAANSVIQADASAPDDQRERVIHVLNGSVTLSNLTLRNGRVANQRAGGGLRIEAGATAVLNDVVVSNNTADGNAGGILNQGTLTLNDAAVTDNRTVNSTVVAGSGVSVAGGGGIFSSRGSVLNLNDSSIQDNIARGPGRVDGGGVLSLGTLTVDNGLIADNVSEGAEGASGGGLSVSDGSFTMIQSTVSGNRISGGGRGGGIDAVGAASDIRLALITRNTGDGSGLGIALGFGTLADSVVSSNGSLVDDCSTGGGMTLSSDSNVLGSSIVDNRCSGSGGGAFLLSNSRITNSSLLNNHAGTGGGIFSGTGGISLSNVTISGNSSNGSGGGVFADGNGLRIRNSVIADNQASGTSADCIGTINSDGNNLVQSATGCTFVTQGSDSLNTNAGLLGAADNGGPSVGSTLATPAGMVTRAPSSSSPLVDTSSPAGCTDADGALLSVDQLGNPRSSDGPDPDDDSRCDIGALELRAPTPPSITVFRDGFE